MKHPTQLLTMALFATLCATAPTIASTDQAANRSASCFAQQCCKCNVVKAKLVRTKNLHVGRRAQVDDLAVKGRFTRCPQFNVYWFGDSLSDIGNLQALRPDLAVDLDLPLPMGPPVMSRFNESGRNSNGLVFPDFLADTCGFKEFLGSTLNDLPSGVGNLVNFAISGASQDNNFNLYLSQEVPLSLSITFQVKQLCNLLDKANTTLSADDVCVVEDTLNDLNIILFNSILGIPGNIPPFQPIPVLVQQYIDTWIANIDALFNKGCKRLFMQLFDQVAPTNAPGFQKLNNNFPGILGLADVILAQMQAGLRAAIAAKTPIDWPDLDITIVNLTDLVVETQQNPNLYAIRQTPNNETMVDLGWPTILAQNVFYFDDVHPTEHTHKLIANFIENYFTKCGQEQDFTAQNEEATVHDCYCNVTWDQDAHQV